MSQARKQAYDDMGCLDIVACGAFMEAENRGNLEKQAEAGQKWGYRHTFLPQMESPEAKYWRGYLEDFEFVRAVF